MTKEELVNYLKTESLNVIKSQAPYRTGNLMDSIKVKDTNEGFEVYIDETQAEYAPYTIYPWISPKWRGKHNPNEGWTTKGVDQFISKVTIKLQK